jgi:hypothetical protein
MIPVMTGFSGTRYNEKNGIGGIDFFNPKRR